MVIDLAVFVALAFVMGAVIVRVVEWRQDVDYRRYKAEDENRPPATRWSFE
jgi:hypothetical protein